MIHPFSNVVEFVSNFAFLVVLYIRYNCRCCILTLKYSLIWAIVQFICTVLFSSTVFQMIYLSLLFTVELHWIMSWMNRPMPGEDVRWRSVAVLCPVLPVIRMLCVCPECPGRWGVTQTQCGWGNFACWPGGSRNRSVFKHKLQIL